MLKAMTDLNAYKMPNQKIRVQRKVFYDLHRNDGESMELWLNRVEGASNRCEFPVFAKFMLIDKFVSALKNDEVEMIIQIDVRRRTWSYKQLREFVLDCKNEKPENKRPIESNEKPIDNDETPPNDVEPDDEVIPVDLNIVKSEPIDDDWIQQNELLDEVNDLLQSSTVFAGMAMKSKATIAEVKPPALTPAPTLAAKVPPVEVRPKPKINVTSHVVIKGVKCEIDNYEYAVEEALEAAAAAANADAGDNDADDDALPSYQQFEKYVVNAPGNSPLKFYACNQCKRTFSHIKSLKRHSMTHIDAKLFACDECDMAFNRSEQLKSHKICVHQVINPFVCDVCGKHFGTAATLKLHVLTHTGERPHACDMCDRTFSLMNNLNVHKRNVHFGVRSHQCNECHKSFACNRNLQYHLGTHKKEKPYPCNQCDKSFPQPENLLRHQKVIHSETRLHVCEVCDRSFSNSSNLKRHSLQHNKPKRSFRCNVCKISLRSELILIKHKQKFHSKFVPKR